MHPLIVDTNQWLAQLGDFALDSEHRCGLGIGPDQDLLVEVNPSTNTLHLLAPLMEVASEQQTPLYHAAMRLNSQGLAMDGASLAVDPRFNDLVLTRALPANEATTEQLGPTVKKFMDHVSKLKEQFRTFSQALISELSADRRPID